MTASLTEQQADLPWSHGRHAEDIEMGWLQHSPESHQQFSGKTLTYRLYVICGLTRITCMSLLFIALIYMLIRSVFLIRLVIERALTSMSMIKVLMYFIPDLIVFCTPWAIFIAIVVFYGRIRENRSFVAMQAAGYSPWQLARPALEFVMMMTPIVVVCVIWLAPYGEIRVRRTMVLEPIKNFGQIVRPGEFVNLGSNAVVYVEEIAENGDLLHVLIYNRLLSGVDVIATSSRATLSVNEKSVLALNFQQGSLQVLPNASLIDDPNKLLDQIDDSIRPQVKNALDQLDGRSNNVRASLDFEEYTLLIDIVADRQLERRTAAERTLWDLYRFLTSAPVSMEEQEVLENQVRAIERTNRILMVLAVGGLSVLVMVVWPFGRRRSIMPSMTVLVGLLVLDILTYNISAMESKPGIPLGISLLFPTGVVLTALVSLIWLSWRPGAKMRDPRVSSS